MTVLVFPVRPFFVDPGVRTLAKIGGIGVFLTLILLAPPAFPQNRLAAADKVTTLAVTAVGVLPGFKLAEAPQYIAAQMAKTGVAGWAFVPAPTGEPQAADRIEWRFRLNPYAGGGIRQIIPIPSLQRFFGVHRLISVEVRLYLGDEYQTMNFGEATIQGGARDQDLAALVTKLTQNLLGAKGAYRAIDVSPKPRRPAGDGVSR